MRVKFNPSFTVCRTRYRVIYIYPQYMENPYRVFNCEICEWNSGRLQLYRSAFIMCFLNCNVIFVRCRCGCPAQLCKCAIVCSAVFIYCALAGIQLQIRCHSIGRSFWCDHTLRLWWCVPLWKQIIYTHVNAYLVYLLMYTASAISSWPIEASRENDVHLAHGTLKETFYSNLSEGFP